MLMRFNQENENNLIMIINSWKLLHGERKVNNTIKVDQTHVLLDTKGYLILERLYHLLSVSPPNMFCQVFIISQFPV